MKVIRDMDGVYFRVERDGMWIDLCFSDLTPEEREEMMKGRSEVWLKSLAQILANRLYDLGQYFERAE